MNDRSNKLNALPETRDYEVGYAKPPQEGRFKPGRSGNPKGRPKGAKSKRSALNEKRLKDIILDEAIPGDHGSRWLSKCFCADGAGHCEGPCRECCKRPAPGATPLC